jgi:copper transport protein
LGSLLFAALIALLIGAPQASAHAVLISSSPTDGGRLAKAPALVSLKFDEPVGISVGYLRVVDSAGRRVDTGAATHPGGDGTTVQVQLKTGLADGSYLASFRVVSADSHPIAGSIRFVVGNGPLAAAGQSSAGTSQAGGVSASLAVAHWLSFAGVGLVGGSWLIFTIWPAGQERRAVRKAIWSGWTLAVLGALGEFLLQGPYAAGSSLSSIFHGELMDATLHINTGQLLSLRLVLIGVLGAVLVALLSTDGRPRPSWGPEAAAIVGIGIVVTYAASGHAESANPKWLAVVVDALHLTAMIVWLGGLSILVVGAISRRREARVAVGDRSELTEQGESDESDEPDESDADGAELAAGLPIFSRVALIAVATLAVTGTIQAWRELGTVNAITTTNYGRLVIAKVALLAMLIGLGYVARRIVLRRDWFMGSRGADPLRRMGRTLLVEVFIGACVLGVTGVLISQPPGSVALAAQRAQPKSVNVQVTAATKALVEVSPGTHGTVGFSVDLIGSVNPIAVTGSATMPAQGLGPIPLKLQADGPRSYTATGVILPVAGLWEITLTVQTSQFDSTTAIAKVKLS